MQFDWKFAGTPPSDAELDEFERVHGVRLLDEHRWFLQNIVNGGFLMNPYLIPTTDCVGGAASLQDVFGVNHPDPNYDLGRALGVEHNWALEFDKASLGRYVPFGGDAVGGQVLIDVTTNIGQVVYNPRDPYEFCYSADSIHHFLETLVFDDSE